MQETQETWSQFLDQENSLEEGVATAPVCLPGESYGQRSLAGYSPWGQIESEMTEATDHTHTQSDSVLFVRGFLTLQLEGLSPDSGHFWLPQGPGCRWSGRTVAGPYTNNVVQTKKGATLGGCRPVLGFIVSKQDKTDIQFPFASLATHTCPGPSWCASAWWPQGWAGASWVSSWKAQEVEREEDAFWVSRFWYFLGYRREIWAYFIKLEVFKMGPLDSQDSTDRLF